MKKAKRFIGDLIHQRFPWAGAYISAAYGYLRAPKKSYSLYGEDLLLLHLFNHEPNGTYVDIGAFHERWISNTNALAKLGWSGAAIDVDKGKLISFSARRNCYTKIGAVVPKGFTDDAVVLYKFNRMSSEYDTIDKVTADDYVNRYGLNYHPVPVPAIPIDKLLEWATEKLSKKIRYLNIDIEGADEAILMSIDPSRFGIEVIQFESNLEFGGSQPLRKHMSNCGYTLVAVLGGTHTYAANEIIKKRFPGANKKAGLQTSRDNE